MNSTELSPNHTTVLAESATPPAATLAPPSVDWLGVADLALPQHAAALVQLLDEYAQHPMGGGAALPGATISAENQANGAMRQTVADALGTEIAP